MIKVYKDRKEETTLPQPQLKLIVSEKYIIIVAVNENEKDLASIWCVTPDGSTFFHIRAQEDIEKNQHSTDWAEWDSDGRFIKLK